MFEKSLSPSLVRPPSKEVLLKQADGMRDLARRARHLAGNVTNESDQRRLLRYVDELEESSARLEKDAVGAKTG